MTSQQHMRHMLLRASPTQKSCRFICLKSVRNEQAHHYHRSDDFAMARPLPKLCKQTAVNKSAHYQQQFNFRYFTRSRSSQIRNHNDGTASTANSSSSLPGSRSRSDTKFSGPSLTDFISQTNQSNHQEGLQNLHNDESYFRPDQFIVNDKSVYIETYGCQMNVNDTEIAWRILQDSGYVKATNIDQADVVLAVTCAIREGAEQKIWKRLEYFKAMKKRKAKKRPMTIGLLGCMAERLKHKILEREKMVDVVCGPDAYRDLPRLLSMSSATNEAAVNVQLSFEETYADVVPVRLKPNSPSAFVSIMRGCDNMCTYCIVPFTRGRERSRPIHSIVEEVQQLSEQGVREVTLLGQNVNSYRDLSGMESRESEPTMMSAGFKTVYKPKTGGRRFGRLLESVALVDPEMRIRFTSPHPKDFPDDFLHAIKEHPNICNQIHLPAQSGNSQVLKDMARGYTRESYLSLVEHIKSILPDIALSSDFIAGFCGETEEAHQDTLSLLSLVKYNYAFCFPYSMREKTRAYHRLEDDVAKHVKNRRHLELTDTYRKYAQERHEGQAGQIHLVLVEGESKKSASDLCGRNDANTKVVFHDVPLGSLFVADGERKAQSGDYVAVEITSGNSLGFKGTALYRTTLQGFTCRQAEEGVKCGV